VSGSPLIVGSTAWSLQQDGALIGLDAATGARLATLSVGDASRFATPASSGNALFLPTNHGTVGGGDDHCSTCRRGLPHPFRHHRHRRW
jgi:hypothetical protein